MVFEFFSVLTFRLGLQCCFYLLALQKKVIFRNMFLRLLKQILDPFSGFCRSERLLSALWLDLRTNARSKAMRFGVRKRFLDFFFFFNINLYYHLELSRLFFFNAST